MKKFLLSILTQACVLTGIFAQDQLITYHGQFRTLLADYRMSGNILNGDTASARRGAMGSLFLDLGVNVKPNEDFKLLAEFRLRNIIGQDPNVNGVTVLTGNDLIDTRMIFRQVRAEGNIRKVVHYQIGDIDLGLTKYTLYNNYETYHEYESELFRERRTIAHYENFQNGNLWRLQGVSAKSTVNFNKVLRSMDVMMFGTRTRKNNFELDIQDRFLVGGKLEAKQSKYLTLGVNWTNFFDVPGTALDTLYNYNNHVLSLTYKITPVDKTKYEFSIVGENGISKNKYFIESLDSTNKKNDYFIDAGIQFVYKPKKIQLTASYINVGHNFTSPGAQTLRLRPTEQTNILGEVNNATSVRSLTVFDRYASEMIYNQRIQTGLMVFLPVYGNVLPYGAATPNRSGMVFNLGRQADPEHVLLFDAGGAMLSELVSEGDSTGKELRKFIQLKGGVALKINKLIGFEKNLLVSVGGRYENTSRAGGAEVDFTSLLLDAGLSVEVFKGVSLIGGMKLLQGEGREVITMRDVFGGISGYTPYLYDVNQSVLSGGIKMNLFKNSFGSLEYNKVTVQNNADGNQDYSIGNLFINFTLRF